MSIKYPRRSHSGLTGLALAGSSARAKTGLMFTLLLILNRLILIGLGIVLLQWWLRNREEQETIRTSSLQNEKDITLDRYEPEEAQVTSQSAAEDLQTAAFTETNRVGYAAASTSAPSEVEPVAVQAQPDDLTRLEGIGPKISSLLQAAGITTYRQLAETDGNRLEEILRGAGLRLADPGTWPEQARLLADGKIQEFENLIGQLKAGRRA